MISMKFKEKPRIEKVVLVTVRLLRLADFDAEIREIKNLETNNAGGAAGNCRRVRVVTC